MPYYTYMHVPSYRSPNRVHVKNQQYRSHKFAPIKFISSTATSDLGCYNCDGKAYCEVPRVMKLYRGGRGL